MYCSFNENAYSQNNKTESIDLRSKEAFDRYLCYINSYRELKSNEVLVRTAQFFIGKPYVASTLEQSEEERLVINLEEFDCTTFVETCVALTLMVKSDDLSFENFSQKLQNIRYKNGVIDGYSSRLHYMTSWVADNCSKGILCNITKELGGTSINKKINYMSTHWQQYPKLKNDKSEIHNIQKIESDIDSGVYQVIPKNRIVSICDVIQSGDIVIFATRIEGLDYSHLGIVAKDQDMPRMIHASSVSKKVIAENRSIQTYCNASRNCVGVTLLRIVDKN